MGVSVDAVRGTVLSLDLLPNGEAATLTAWVQELADGAGGRDPGQRRCRSVQDGGGCERAAAASLQEPMSGATRTAWVEAITPALAADADGSLAAIGVSPAQAVADCQELLRLMTERQPTPGGERARWRPSTAATWAPRSRAKGGTMSLAYRLRLFSLDRWNLWPRLTRYRTWAGPDGETLDGTNNACERAIGWWVKERYRVDARLQAARLGAPRQSPHRRHGQRAGWSRLRPRRGHRLTARGKGGRPPPRPPSTKV